MDPSGAEFTGDLFYNPIKGIQTRGIFDSYTVEADKKAPCLVACVNGGMALILYVRVG